MDKELIQDEDTAVSGSGSGSGITDLSILENETDEFGRRILQHERETRRAKTAARQPFWRARPRSWVIDQIADEQEEAIETGRPGHRRTASAGNAGSDPPLNVPKEWGKRSRRRSSWLRRHDSENEAQLFETDQVEEPVRVDEDSIIPRRTVYTGDGWAAGLDMRRSSLETTPPSMRRLQRHASSPSSMQHMNTTLPSTDTDDDFSAASLLASTPANNQRNRKIDELVRREIETVEKRGVTKRTLNQITERLSNEQLRPSTAPAAETSRIPRPRSSIENKQSGMLGTTGPRLSLAPQAANSKNPHKSSHGRNDSMSLLRRLARVSSLSPTPAKETTASDQVVTNGASQPTEDGSGADDLDHGLPNGAQQEGKKPKVEFDLPNLDSEIQVVTEEPVLKLSQEPEPRIIVTRFSTKKSEPKSALEEVLNEARFGRDDQIGESTIASLENIIKPGPELSQPSSEVKDEKFFEEQRQQNNAAGKGLNLHQQQEKGALAVLTNGLKAAQTTVKSTATGLRSITDRLGEIEIASISTTPPENFRPYTDHNGRTVCDHCGGCYNSVWRGLWVEFRENFYTWDPRSKFHLRFTWLGIACIIWWSWFLLETTLCSNYCHPRYARSMEGYGVDPDAPEFPFVIPTLLLRPFRSLWKPVGVFLAWLVGSMFQSLFSSSNLKSRESTDSFRERGSLGAKAVKFMPKANFAKHVAASVGVGSNWVTTAAAATSSTTRRVVESTIEAVDRFARLWEDGIGPS